MAEFDLDSIISGFEGKQPKAKSNALDVEGLLSGFKTSEPVSIEVPKKKLALSLSHLFLVYQKKALMKLILNVH